MGVHSIHVFDRKGSVLFTKTYAPPPSNSDSHSDPERESEQRKLIFGMIYSLTDITKILSPTNNNSTNSGLHSVRTSTCTLHTYETTSGLKFCLYTDQTDSKLYKTVRSTLHSLYHELYITCVTQSPLYNPTAPNVSETNFEPKLDEFLKAQPWF